MINIFAVCPCVFQRSRPTLAWLILIHLAFTKELLILRELHPHLTWCVASGVFMCVTYDFDRSVMSVGMISAQTINVRDWPQVSIHFRVQEIGGWYKTFIFSQCHTGGQGLFCANDFYRIWSVCKCVYSCLVLIFPRMIADTPLPHVFFFFFL